MTVPDGVVGVNQDLSELYGTAVTLLLGADAGGDSAFDWAHWTDAEIQIDAAPKHDLEARAPTANWHSSVGRARARVNARPAKPSNDPARGARYSPARVT